MRTQGVEHELALRHSFQDLLGDSARLVGQVIRVSLETVRILKASPDEFC
jgi:hypothetical protein